MNRDNRDRKFLSIFMLSERKKVHVYRMSSKCMSLQRTCVTGCYLSQLRVKELLSLLQDCKSSLQMIDTSVASNRPGKSAYAVF